MAVDPRQVNKTFSLMGQQFIAGASTIVDRLAPNTPINLRREPNNKADKNAILCLWGQRPIGYVPRQLASEIAPIMDAGIQVICRKAPPLPRFGAYRGIMEMAYIPPEPKEVPDVTVPKQAADSTGRTRTDL